jgi:hypothetical protein
MSPRSLTIDPTTLTRRQLLRTVFLAGGASALAPLLGTHGGAALAATAGGDQLAIPLGPLAGIGPLGAPDADGVAVPQGFSVRPVARSATPPVLGRTHLWHAFPDGGATFARPEGGWIYTSNSELPDGAGGCGALMFDPDGTVVDSYSVLDGTSSNCAGGATPWATWLSCEEHASGRVWETDPFGVTPAVEKPGLGTFSHEAAAVDFAKRTVYLTEDDGNSRFYRWVAAVSDRSPNGDRLALEKGVLQVMSVTGFENGKYPGTADVRRLRRVTWSNVIRADEPQSTVRDELAASGHAVPGTRFAGGEGLWFHELPRSIQAVPQGGTVPTRGVVFWTTKGDNRVWALDVENQLVEIIFDNAQIEPDFDDVDNVTVSPWGDVIVVEDLVTAGRPIRMIVVVPNGPAKVLVAATQPGSEFTGPAFSPDGSRLYFSSQRGPNVPGAQAAAPAGAPGSGTGVTYELSIPPKYRRA